jgi:tetratricopeptide (TPR) repeat protein
MVIGAVAGAGTGAAIGNSLDAQDQRMRTQDEALARQRELITAQRSEIDELKRNDTQEFTPPPPASEGAAPAALRERSLENGAAGTVNTAASGTGASGGADMSRSLEYELEKARAADQHAALREDTSAAPSAARSRKTARHTAPAAIEAPKKSVAARIEPDIAPPSEKQVSERTLVGQGADQAKPESDDTTAADSVSPAAWGDTGPGASGSTPAAYSRGAVENTGSDDCKKAQKEVSQGDSAADASDKLFHLRRALRLCPDNASYHNKLGEVYRSLNRTADAQFEFREALNIDPAFQAARENLGGAH